MCFFGQYNIVVHKPRLMESIFRPVINRNTANQIFFKLSSERFLLDIIYFFGNTFYSFITTTITIILDFNSTRNNR